MKLKEVDLTRPHYVVVIDTTTSHIYVTKAKRSTIQKFKYKIKNYEYKSVDFYIYPELETLDSCIDSPIVSLMVNPEEEIYMKEYYLRFNLHHRSEINYIIFDIQTMVQLIRKYFKKKIQHRKTNRRYSI